MTSLRCQSSSIIHQARGSLSTHESHLSSIPKSLGGDWSRSFAGIIVTGWNPGYDLESLNCVMMGGVRMYGVDVPELVPPGWLRARRAAGARDVGLPPLFCDPELLSMLEVLIAARGGEPGGEEDEADMVLFIGPRERFRVAVGKTKRQCQRLEQFLEGRGLGRTHARGGTSGMGKIAMGRRGR